MPTHSRPFVALGFRTTHEALAAERVLHTAGVDAVPVPAPKSFGALCGIAMRFPPDQEPGAIAALADAGIEPERRVTIEDRVSTP
ncbi:MAG: DUF3343 domain-containing protein [Actinomycetota bacterium]|nr:DUF3343 domain-containing protein [Actinomycetota bacterium]